jgi:hypothetical protein
MIYYLEGSQSKGPFTKEELKQLNLNNETLVYSIEWNSWKKINELPELLNFLTSDNFQIKDLSKESNLKDESIIIKPFFVYLSLLLTSFFCNPLNKS